jgi:nucleotide-binding universal stress UspA family protein
MPETTPRKVLVGVASGESVDAALDFAVSEALRRGVGVHLVHAVNPVLLAADPQSWAVIEGSLRRVGSDALEAATATVEHRLGPEHPVSTELVHGPAVPALVSESERARVVVLQQPPLGDRTHVFTLSVTNGVAARARVPVVAVPTGWDEHASTAPVVAGVERPDRSHEVVRLALEEARARQVPLRIVHAWRYSDAYDDVVFEDGARTAQEDHLRQVLAHGLADVLAEYDDVEAELVLRHGHAADVLVEESRAAALLVLGRHQSAVSHGAHLGSIVRGVLKESRCPVMVVDPVTEPVTPPVRDPGSGPVVAAVDGSPSSDSAIRKAVHEARSLGAPLRLVHVVPDYLPISPMMPLTPAELTETAERILAHSERVARVTGPELREIGIVMPRGSRVHGIVDASADARLLVMGRDRSFVQRLVSGRTVAGVAERVSCPVESVPPDWQDSPRFGAVLVGVRSPVDAVPLLAHAAPVAAGRAARLVVLHAWKLPTGYDDIISSRVALAEWETRTLAELEPLLEPWRSTYPELPVEIRVVHDRPVHALVRASEHADLLIVMRRPHLVSGGFHLGGTARAVLRAAQCTVRIVPPAAVSPRPEEVSPDQVTAGATGP